MYSTPTYAELRDSVVGFKSLGMLVGEGGSHRISYDEESDAIGIVNGKFWGLSQTALDNICEHAGIPSSYAKKCPKSLLTTNLQHWFHTNWSCRAITREDTIQGFTQGNKPFVSPERVLDTVDEALKEYPGFQPRLVRAEDLSYTVYFVDESISLPVGSGSIYGAVELRTTPTGLFNTRVVPATFQFICTNGMTTGRRVLKSGTISPGRRDESQMVSALKRAVGDSCITVHDVLRNLQAMQEMKAPSLDKVFDILYNRHWDLISRGMMTRVSESLDSYTEPLETIFDVIAALTWAAHQEGFSLAESSALEEVSGDLLYDIVEGKASCRSCGTLLVHNDH